MDELIQAMSIPELQTFKETYKDNQSITTIIDGYIEVKTRQEAQDKAKEDFGKAIEDLATYKVETITNKKGHTKQVARGLPPPPDGVHNVYLAWREVDVEDTSQEPEMVDVVVTQAIMDGDGNITTPAVVEPQPRYPTVKSPQWVVELNKGFTIGKAASGGNGIPSTNKRGVTVHKRNGTSLELVGNFPSGQVAANYLKVPVGVSSAPKVLRDEGYIVDPYTGTDYTG